MLVILWNSHWKNLDSPSHSSEWKRDRWDILTQHMIYILDDVSQTQVSRFNIKKDPGLHVSFRESRFCLEKKVFILKSLTVMMLNIFWASTEAINWHCGLTWHKRFLRIIIILILLVLCPLIQDIFQTFTGTAPPSTFQNV